MTSDRDKRRAHDDRSARDIHGARPPRDRRAVRSRPIIYGGIAVILGLAAAVTGALLATRDAPEPPPGPPLGETALKYRLEQLFSPIFFCDPDFYPVGSEDLERQRAAEWWSSADHDGDEVTTILEQLGIRSEPNEQQILRAYREHKLLAAIGLEAAGDGFRFTLRSGVEGDATRVAGTIARDGSEHVEQREASNTACPICLAASTLIDTPSGQVPISSLHAGMQVWTLDGSGRRVVGVVLRTARRTVAAPVLLLRVTLEDGRSIVASAAHPDARGRSVGAFVPGDVLDGSRVASVGVIAVPDGVTYDLLPSGPTGVYLADGVALGSTLHR